MSDDTVKAFGIVAAVIVIVVGLFLVESWVLMLLLGGLHSVTGWACNAGGFHAAMFLSAITGVVISRPEKAVLGK